MEISILEPVVPEKREDALLKQKIAALERETFDLKAKLTLAERKLGRTQDMLAAERRSLDRYHKMHEKSYRECIEAQKADNENRSARIAGALLCCGVGLMLGVALCLGI